MLSTIGAKIKLAMLAVIGALVLMLRGEKSKRKVAEFEASTEKGNRELLEKEKTVLNKIEEDRKVWDEEQAESHLDNVVELEKLKNEDDDSVVVDSMLSMYNKDSNKTKAD
jgi:archaellum biogenesis ATPase FlaH